MLMFKKGWGKPMQKKANKQPRGGRGYAKQSKGTQGASDGTPHSTNIRFSQTEHTPQPESNTYLTVSC